MQRGLWQHPHMDDSDPMLDEFDRRLIDRLYVDAMVLADEARGYFDDRADEHRAVLGRVARVEFACESLKVTTRLMHVIAWLLTQRAILNGELSVVARESEHHQLGPAADTPAEIAEAFCEEMTMLIANSEELYDRVARLEKQFLARAVGVSPALMSLGSPHDLLSRLERAF